MYLKSLAGGLLFTVSLSALSQAQEQPTQQAAPSVPFFQQLLGILANAPDTPCYIVPELPSRFKEGEKYPVIVCEAPGMKIMKAPGQEENSGTPAPETLPRPENTPQKDPKPENGSNKKSSSGYLPV